MSASTPDSTADSTADAASNAASNSTPKPDMLTRAFGSRAFFRLWSAQFITSIGDWIGLLAITVTAAKIWGDNSGTAIGLVIGARVIPSLFFGQIGGVLADRWNRYRVMVACDVGRALLYGLLPFVDTVWQLILVSLVIEALTMLWIPAKEAIVPSLLPKEELAKANSLSAFATYGTFPLASGVLFALTWVVSTVDEIPGLSWFRIDEQSLGFYGNAITFLAAAVIIGLLGRTTGQVGGKTSAATATAAASDQPESGGGFAAGIREFMDGWRFIAFNPIVRAVNFGLATALIGGGLLIPLGVVFAKEVLGAGATGYVGLQIALGSGVAVGVLVVSLMSRMIHTNLGRLELFALAATGAFVSLLVTATFSLWVGVVLGVAALGVCAGFVYVLGFTILHIEVSDEMRGRVFSALYSLVRLCLVLSLVFGALLSDLLDALVPNEIVLFGQAMALPGVRLTLWLGALIIGGAALFIHTIVKRERDRRKTTAGAAEPPDTATSA